MTTLGLYLWNPSEARRVVLRQSGLTINSSPHITNHYMFGFNFITLLLLRFRCHIIWVKPKIGVTL